MTSALGNYVFSTRANRLGLGRAMITFIANQKYLSIQTLLDKGMIDL